MPKTEIHGAREIGRGLGNTIHDLETDVPRVSAEVAERIRTDATRSAPKRSGRLAASGRVSRSGSVSTVSFGGGSVDYAPPMNFGVGPRPGLRGGHNIRATRFFTNAIRANVASMEPEYSTVIQRSLDKIHGA